MQKKHNKIISEYDIDIVEILTCNRFVLKDVFPNSSTIYATFLIRYSLFYVYPLSISYKKANVTFFVILNNQIKILYSRCWRIHMAEESTVNSVKLSAKITLQNPHYKHLVVSTMNKANWAAGTLLQKFTVALEIIIVSILFSQHCYNYTYIIILEDIKLCRCCTIVPTRDLKAIIIFGRFDARRFGPYIVSFGRVPDYKIKFIDFVLVFAFYSFCFGMFHSLVCVTCCVATW